MRAYLFAQNLPLTRQAHAGELLFEIPYGFRPTGPVTWPLVDEQGFHFDVQVSPEGHVTYGPQPRGADGEALDGYEQVAYHTTVTWTTQEDPRIEASGHYRHLPAGRGGIYRLVRRGNTVSAWLEADATPVPVWYRPASVAPLAQLSVHPDTPLLRSHWKPDLNVYRVRYTDKIGRLEHDPANPYPEVRYDIVGRSCCFMSSNTTVVLVAV